MLGDILYRAVSTSAKSLNVMSSVVRVLQGCNLRAVYQAKWESNKSTTFQYSVPREVRRWLAKICRFVQWEKWETNVTGTKEGKGEKQVRTVVVGWWEANRMLNHFFLPWVGDSFSVCEMGRRWCAAVVCQVRVRKGGRERAGVGLYLSHN